MPNVNTVIVWRGPSLLDGQPIAVFLSGLARHSKNPKTGDMLQTWILRTDKSPLDIVYANEDYSICGDCKHRGDGIKGRSCYVQIKNAPLQIYRKYARGGVPDVSIDALVTSNRKVRFGAYGDPAAVPTEIWEGLAAKFAGYTGYTHQWRQFNLQKFCMASVDTEAEQAEAIALGYRTFRVKVPSDLKLISEVICPASAEMNHRSTCERCSLCNGSRDTDRRRSIVIDAHGVGKFKFIRLMAA